MIDITNIHEAPAPSPEEATKRAAKLISEAWPQITAVCVAYASEGSVPHAKLLYEIQSASAPKAKGKEKTSEREKELEKEAAQDRAKDPACQLIEMLIDTIAGLRSDYEGGGKPN